MHLFDLSLRKNFPSGCRERSQLLASSCACLWDPSCQSSRGHSLPKVLDLTGGLPGPSHFCQTPLMGVMCFRAPRWVGQGSVRPSLHSKAFLDQPSPSRPLLSQELAPRNPLALLNPSHSASWWTQLTLHEPASANPGYPRNLSLSKLKYKICKLLYPERN